MLEGICAFSERLIGWHVLGGCMSLWGLGREFHQDHRISEAKAAANRGANQAQRTSRDLREHARRLDKLTMICMAMWSLLQEHTDLEEDDLLKRVEEIDLKDGKLDGKASPVAATCPTCGRRFHPKRSHCMYCGGERSLDSAFDQVL